MFYPPKTSRALSFSLLARLLPPTNNCYGSFCDVISLWSNNVQKRLGVNSRREAMYYMVMGMCYLVLGIFLATIVGLLPDHGKQITTTTFLRARKPDKPSSALLRRTIPGSSSPASF